MVLEAEQKVVAERVDEVSPADTDTTTRASIEPSVHTVRGFPGGPSDRFVLTGFADHIAYRIWHGEERSMLKVAFYGSKLKNFPESPMSEEVKKIISEFHLLEFVDCSLTNINIKQYKNHKTVQQT